MCFFYELLIYYFNIKMNYSYMYGYYIGEIFKKVYEDWAKYNDNPKLIFKELTDYGYPEYHANFLT